MKVVHSQGGGGLFSANILGTKREKCSSDADDRTFGCKKISEISKFMMCLQGQGGTVKDQFFAIWCGSLLWTALYLFKTTVTKIHNR